MLEGRNAPGGRVVIDDGSLSPRSMKDTFLRRRTRATRFPAQVTSATPVRVQRTNFGPGSVSLALDDRHVSSVCRRCADIKSHLARSSDLPGASGPVGKMGYQATSASKAARCKKAPESIHLYAAASARTRTIQEGHSIPLSPPPKKCAVEAILGRRSQLS